MTARKRQSASDALEILHHRYYEHDPARQKQLSDERRNAAIARRLYRLRNSAGLTQLELARKVGTTASVISRLEDADYEGHSLSMLRRVADALGKDVEVRFVSRAQANHS